MQKNSDKGRVVPRGSDRHDVCFDCMFKNVNKCIIKAEKPNRQVG